jgi:hypothetical protein
MRGLIETVLWRVWPRRMWRRRYRAEVRQARRAWFAGEMDELADRLAAAERLYARACGR